jgi:single-stranded-DNA-specific exonuclease
MAKRWRIRPFDQARVLELQRLAGVPPIVAQLLLARDISDPSAALRFLGAALKDLYEPTALPGVPAAASIIVEMIRRGEQVCIYGDYDADGITATAVLFRCLRALGTDVFYHVPHRIDDGYGLHDDALRKIAARGAKLIVTVDCGITAIEQAETARSLGMKLVISDHHELGPRLPPADVVVHPKLPGGGYPFPGLAGSGVAFKLAWAICQEYEKATRVSGRLKQLLITCLGLAALGTVADVVPLVDENRILVRHGISALQQSSIPGVRALLRITELSSKAQLESDDVAFTLAPRLNAAGRLGQAALAVELLTTDSEERAQSLAEYLHELNANRETLERRVYTAAKKQCEDLGDPGAVPALVLSGRGWHPGVIGIVAGRLAERYHVPVAVISFDEVSGRPGIGSARSIAGLDLHAALSACSHRLVTYGGHAAAAGLRIEESQVQGFRAEFCEHVATRLSSQDRVAELWIDGEAPLSALTRNIVEQIECLAPFGHGNPRPLLYTETVRLIEAPRRIGGGGRHLSLRLEQHGVTMRAVAFGGGEWADELAALTQPIEVAFRPVLNTFRGRRNVELQLADWRITSMANKSALSLA